MSISSTPPVHEIAARLFAALKASLQTKVAQGLAPTAPTPPPTYTPPRS